MNAPSDQDAGAQTPAHNPKREEQHAQAAQSPIKEPATETAHTSSGESEKALAAGVRPGPVQPNPAVTGAGAQSSFSSRRQPSSSLAEARPHDLGVGNDATMDSSVDTDGKAREAARNLPISRDHVISSNASLDDSVATPDQGLGGIESRPGGNAPLIATAPGYRMEYLGSVAELSPWRVDEWAEAATQPHAAEPAPSNGTRVAHVIRLVRTGQG